MPTTSHPALRHLALRARSIVRARQRPTCDGAHIVSSNASLLVEKTCLPWHCAPSLIVPKPGERLLQGAYVRLRTDWTPRRARTSCERLRWIWRSSKAAVRQYKDNAL